MSGNGRHKKNLEKAIIPARAINKINQIKSNHQINNFMMHPRQRARFSHLEKN
jgi:hypothetical protein